MFSNLCTEIQEASAYVADWTRRQPSVGEESITDWLLYQLNKTVPELRYEKYSRYNEAHKTGADWEWWFAGRRHSLKLRIQAKRIRRNKSNYPGLAHCNVNGLQIDMLRNSALACNALPYYVHYAEETVFTKSCGLFSPADRSLYFAPADRVYQKFIQPGPQKVSSSDVLKHAHFLECLFCCPRMPGGSDRVLHILNQLRRLSDAPALPDDQLIQEPGIHQEVPSYVQRIIEQRRSDERDDEDEISADYVPNVNYVVVLDYRD